jgi:hypothetical protein
METKRFFNCQLLSLWLGLGRSKGWFDCIFIVEDEDEITLWRIVARWKEAKVELNE